MLESQTWKGTREMNIAPAQWLASCMVILPSACQNTPCTEYQEQLTRIVNYVLLESYQRVRWACCSLPVRPSENRVRANILRRYYIILILLATTVNRHQLIRNFQTTMWPNCDAAKPIVKVLSPLSRLEQVLPGNSSNPSGKHLSSHVGY